MGQKSSAYRGVTMFKPTQRWRAQISSGGKTLSLGDHECEEEAARAFDRASLNKLGPSAKINFSLDEYADELEDLLTMPQGQLVAILREKARKTSAPASRFRGVAPAGGRWQAVLPLEGRSLLVGRFDSEAEAAEAYDRACILRHLGFGGSLQLNLNLTHHADFLRAASGMNIAAYFATLEALPQGQARAAAPLPSVEPPVESPFTPAPEEPHYAPSERLAPPHPEALSPPVGPCLQALGLLPPPALPLGGPPLRALSPRELDSRKRASPSGERDWKTGSNRRVRCRPSRSSPEDF